MSRKLLLSIIILLLITNVATMLFWNKDKPQEETIVENEKINMKEPVATIDDIEISYQDWITALQDKYGEKQLRSMIDRILVKKLAEENNITIDQKIIDRDIAHLTSVQGLTTKEELRNLEQKWQDDIEYRYQLEALLAKDIQIREEDILAHYTKYEKQYQFNKSLQFSHILVSNMDTAQKVYSELESGASFDLLAKEYSIDEDTRDNGGYLGFNSVNTAFLPNNYFEIAEGLEEYTYSEPFVTNNGIAILYLSKRLPNITYKYEELKPYIRYELALQSIEQSLSADLLWEKVDIEWFYGE